MKKLLKFILIAIASFAFFLGLFYFFKYFFQILAAIIGIGILGGAIAAIFPPKFPISKRTRRRNGGFTR